MSLYRPEKLLIVLVAVHSVVLGIALLFMPFTTLRLFGWETGGQIFFPSQSGVFLILLGGAYFAALWHRPFAWLLVVSKGVAVLFLVTHYLLGTGPAVLLAAAFFDGLMGAAVLVVLVRKRDMKNGG